jgi:hypothetical protein
VCIGHHNLPALGLEHTPAVADVKTTGLLVGPYWVHPVDQHETCRHTHAAGSTASTGVKDYAPAKAALQGLGTCTYVLHVPVFTEMEVQQEYRMGMQKSMHRLAWHAK